MRRFQIILISIYFQKILLKDSLPVHVNVKKKEDLSASVNLMTRRKYQNDRQNIFRSHSKKEYSIGYNFHYPLTRDFMVFWDNSNF